MAKNDHFQISSLLALPFSEGILSAPAANEDILIIGASYWSGADQFKGCDVVQTFYPDTHIWSQREFNVYTEINAQKKYKTVLCTVPKQKEAAFFQIANAFKCLSDDGTIVAVAANDAGGKRLEKWVQSFGVETSSMSKSKCRIVWTGASGLNHDSVTQYLKVGAKQKIDVDGLEFMTQPGIYGWNKIDQGSKLLAHIIPNDLKGVGADFGCGYGFLSLDLLSKNNKITKFYAIDADFNALECAKENLKKFRGVEFQWTDITQQKNLPDNLDFIVMNPPFHDGKKTESSIGQKFIEGASQCLKKNGVLYMVANIHLPYEKTLQQNFATVEKCVEQDGFKIFKATV